MVKQQYHLRKIGSKLVPAGKGKRSSMIGKLVWYKKQVYTVVKRNTDGTFNLKNLTARKVANRINLNMLRLY